MLDKSAPPRTLKLNAADNVVVAFVKEAVKSGNTSSVKPAVVTPKKK